MGKPAARVSDSTAHGSPLAPGPGSANVFIGGMPAWRGIPAGAVSGLVSAQTTADTSMKTAEAATLAAAGTPGAPAAKTAEETLKANLAISMASMMQGFAATSDIHVCPVPVPIPPHGPGVVIDGSATVSINGMPACMMGCTVLEGLGGPDKIASGCMTVQIG
ncbi:MAG: motif protein [Akkermansiaceae bacterium]|nr:motif protein [Akkermansiaceae bacterium]